MRECSGASARKGRDYWECGRRGRRGRRSFVLFSFIHEWPSADKLKPLFWSTAYQKKGQVRSADEPRVKRLWTTRPESKKGSRSSGWFSVHFPYTARSSKEFSTDIVFSPRPPPRKHGIAPAAAAVVAFARTLFNQSLPLAFPHCLPVSATLPR